jgi:glycolate oxidase FAD binding subunit
MSIVEPGSEQELADALAAAASQDVPIRLGGKFSKDCAGGPLASAGVTISTARLNQVLQYEPNDLTISVGAGLPYSELTSLLARHRQMVPLDPPWAAESTVGGVVAANLSGPRRRLYGTARDMIIGMRYATLEGKVIQSGGMVVKNVAGLDTAKLMIGSLGTLAAIGVVNFKLTTLPESTRTFLLRFPSVEAALERRDQILKSVLQPSSIDLLNPPAASLVGQEGCLLLVRAGGAETLLSRYAREFSGAEALGGDADAGLFHRVQELIPAFLAANPAGLVMRVCRTITGIGAISGAAQVPVLARAGTGVCYACFPSAAEAATSGMQGLVEFAAPNVKEGLTQWPEPGSDLGLMQQVKNMFDPKHLLNRGRLYGRI